MLTALSPSHYLAGAVALLLVVSLSQCGGSTSAAVPETSTGMTDAQIQKLLTQRTFFGHQSVGDNIVQGIRDEMAADPRLTLSIVASSDPASVSGPAFIESHIGQNTDPPSKDAAFAAIMDSGFGSQGGIAMYKYCYIDVNDFTDIQEMFANYRNVIETMKSTYPRLQVIPITIPLTVAESTAKAWLKSALGKATARDVNVKRNDFNTLLRQAFAGKSIYDLAKVESTHPDGTRSYVIVGGQTVYTLCPEYTDDGGHLNALGRDMAARELLRVLANL